MHISNMVIEVYAMDTAIQRLQKINTSSIHADVTRTYINDAISRVEFAAKPALAAVAEGDALRTQLTALRRLLRWTPVNTVKARQGIADFLIENDGYGL